MTDADKVELVSVRHHPGYSVLLDVMEEMCAEAAREHFQLNPTEVSQAAIVSSQATARAQDLFFQRFQKRVDFIVNETISPPQPEPPSEASLLDHVLNIFSTEG